MGSLITRPTNIGELSSGSYCSFSLSLSLPLPLFPPHPFSSIIAALPLNHPSLFPILFSSLTSTCPIPQIQLGGRLGERCKLPHGPGRARPPNAFWCNGGQNWAIWPWVLGLAKYVYRFT